MNMKTPTLATCFVLAFLLIGSAARAESAAAKHQHRCDRQPLAPLSQGVGGRATLCTGSYGLSARMRATGLAPGDAYTVWWVYIDDPGACIVPQQCELADFGGENPLPVFGRMDSLVAGQYGYGWFADWLRGFRPSAGSQIWLLVFGHGKVDAFDNRHRARQLLTPEDPNAGAPHLGNVVDGGLGFPSAVAVFNF